LGSFGKFDEAINSVTKFGDNEAPIPREFRSEPPNSGLALTSAFRSLGRVVADSEPIHMGEVANSWKWL
jgi:hypothetical protein